MRARFFGIYVGINQNLSKLVKILSKLRCVSFATLAITTHSSTTAMLSYMIPLVGVSMAERLSFILLEYSIDVFHEVLLIHSYSHSSSSFISW